MFDFILILLRGQNRFIDEPAVLNLVACRKFCGDKHGELIDGDLFDELKVTINDTFFYSDLDTKTCFHKHVGECSFLLNVNYDFTTNQWINGITGTIFEDKKWSVQENNIPNYPLMNDLLGNDSQDSE